MPLACFDANSNISTHWKHAKGMSLRYGVIVLGNFYVVVIGMISKGYIRKKRKSWVIPSFKVAGSRIELETSGL